MHGSTETAGLRCRFSSDLGSDSADRELDEIRIHGTCAVRFSFGLRPMDGRLILTIKPGDTRIDLVTRRPELT
jgi:hypothetical protein